MRKNGFFYVLVFLCSCVSCVFRINKGVSLRNPLVLHLDYSVIHLGIEAGTDLAAIQVTMSDDSCIREISF